MPPHRLTPVSQVLCIRLFVVFNYFASCDLCFSLYSFLLLRGKRDKSLEQKGNEM